MPERNRLPPIINSENGQNRSGNGVGEIDPAKEGEECTYPNDLRSNFLLIKLEELNLEPPRELNDELQQEDSNSRHTGSMSAREEAIPPKPIPPPLFFGEEEMTPCAQCENIYCTCPF